MSTCDHGPKGKTDIMPDSKEGSNTNPKEDTNPYFTKETIEKYNNEDTLDDIWDSDGENNSTNLEADKDFIQRDPTDFLDAVLGFHEPGREHNTKKTKEKEKEKEKEKKEKTLTKETLKPKKKKKKGKKVNISNKFRNMDDGYSNYKYSEYDDMFM